MGLLHIFVANFIICLTFLYFIERNENEYEEIS